MKKLLSVVVVLAVIFALGTTSVMAADGDLLVAWEGAELTGRSNGDDQGGVRNPDAGTISLGSGTGHALWGYEPDAYDTASGTKNFTVVLKVKVVEEGEDTVDNVLRVDPKIRPQDGTPEPEDAGDYYSGERLCELTPDADGFLYLYSVIEPDEYADADSIKIENRVWFTNASGWEIDVYAMSLYEGDLSEQYEAIGEGTGEDEGTGDEGTSEGEGSGSTDVPETGDASVVLAIVAAGAAAFGGLKLRKR